MKILSIVDVVPDIYKFFGSGWAIWRGPADDAGLIGEEEQDRRALSMENLDMGTLQVITFQERKTGDHILSFLRMQKKTIAGIKQFVALWENHNQYRHASMLECLRMTHGVKSIGFLGTVLRDPRTGGRCYLLLYYDGQGWHWTFEYFHTTVEVEEDLSVLSL